MIDKTELLRMIMETNQGQAPSFILEQYSTYLKGLEAIHSDNAVLTPDGEIHSTGDVAEEKPKSLTCGYTKRNLVVKPQEAILQDKIICCLCGKEGQTLTERHIATHNGLTREGYRKLCGYSQDQVLMSEKHLKRMQNNVSKAQAVRKQKAEKRNAEN